MKIKEWFQVMTLGSRINICGSCSGVCLTVL